MSHPYTYLLISLVISGHQSKSRRQQLYQLIKNVNLQKENKITELDQKSLMEEENYL